MKENVYVHNITGEAYEVNEYKLVKRTQSEGYKKKLEWANHPFIWVNLDFITEINIPVKLKEHKDFTLTFLGAALFLATYINSEDTLVCRKGRNKTPYTRKEIQELLNMRDRTFAKFISLGKELSLFNTIDGKFYFNREFHFVGKNNDAERYARLYKFDIRALYLSNNKFDTLGFLYLLIPYINYDDCSLVNIDNEFMCKNDLIILLGFSKPTVNKYLSTTFNAHRNKREYSVYAIYKQNQQQIIKLNPLIIRRTTQYKGSIGGDGLLEIFEVKKSA